MHFPFSHEMEWNVVVSGLIDDAKRFNSINYKQQFQKRKILKMWKKINVRKRKNCFALSLLCVARCSMNDLAIFFLPFHRPQKFYTKIGCLYNWNSFPYGNTLIESDLIGFSSWRFCEINMQMTMTFENVREASENRHSLFSTFFQLFIKHNLK